MTTPTVKEIPPKDRTAGQLDRAVVAFREDPTEANRLRLLAAQESHSAAFYAELTGTYLERTR